MRNLAVLRGARKLKSESKTETLWNCDDRLRNYTEQTENARPLRLLLRPLLMRNAHLSPRPGIAPTPPIIRGLKN